MSSHKVWQKSLGELTSEERNIGIIKDYWIFTKPNYG